MSAINNCCQPCPEVQSVNIPGVQGEVGATGATGATGLGVSTTLLENLTIVAPPATSTKKILTNATCSVGKNLWFNWIVSGVAHMANFVVTNVNADGQTITVLYCSVSGDDAVGTTIPAGAYVTVGTGNLTFPLAIANGGTGSNAQATALTALLAASTIPIANGGTGAATAILALNALGVGYAPTAAYGSGTVYTLTTSTQRLNLGTTPPTIAIPNHGVGTYLVFAVANFSYAGAQATATNPLNYVNMKIRNVTGAADLSGASVNYGLYLASALTGVGFSLSCFGVYSTPSPFSSETIELWGNIAIAMTAGSVTCTAASIIAVKIY